MKSKNCQKIVLKALGHILYGSNFIASDVTTGTPGFSDLPTVLKLQKMLQQRHVNQSEVLTT